MVRSAGNGAQLMAKEGNYAQVRLPSGEVRKVRLECRATIGEVGNIGSCRTSRSVKQEEKDTWVSDLQ